MRERRRPSIPATSAAELLAPGLSCGCCRWEEERARKAVRSAWSWSVMAPLTMSVRLEMAVSDRRGAGSLVGPPRVWMWARLVGSDARTSITTLDSSTTGSRGGMLLSSLARRPLLLRPFPSPLGDAKSIHSGGGSTVAEPPLLVSHRLRENSVQAAGFAEAAAAGGRGVPSGRRRPVEWGVDADRRRVRL